MYWGSEARGRYGAGEEKRPVHSPHLLDFLGFSHRLPRLQFALQIGLGELRPRRPTFVERYFALRLSWRFLMVVVRRVVHRVFVNRAGSALLKLLLRDQWRGKGPKVVMNMVGCDVRAYAIVSRCATNESHFHRLSKTRWGNMSTFPYFSV